MLVVPWSLLGFQSTRCHTCDDIEMYFAKWNALSSNYNLFNNCNTSQCKIPLRLSIITMKWKVTSHLFCACSPIYRQITDFPLKYSQRILSNTIVIAHHKKRMNHRLRCVWSHNANCCYCPVEVSTTGWALCGTVRSGLGVKENQEP